MLIKCNVKDCFWNDDNYCYRNVGRREKPRKPNSKKCPYYIKDTTEHSGRFKYR